MFFKESRILEVEIEDYIRTVHHSAMMLHEAIKEYIAGEKNLFDDRVREIGSLEHEADQLKKTIKHKLYSHMLIPEARGDVLGILETVDDLVDYIKKLAVNFSIEHPAIPDFMKDDLLKMTEFSVKAVDELARGVNAYFTDFSKTNDYINKVMFYEHEVDKIEERLKRVLFSSEAFEGLSRRLQFKFFIEEMAQLSDIAESVCERLSIAVIKRMT